MKITSVLLTIVGGICQQTWAVDGPRSFNPSVSATCSQGFMKIRLRTRDPFHGIIHARDSRDNKCLTYGTGGVNTILTVSLLTPHDSDSYCGVVYDNATEVSQVALAVRAHRTLELAGDNFYVITCGKPGFRDTRNNQTTTVSLSLQANGRKITEVTYGRQYQLQADISNPDVFSEEFGIRVKNCFAFSDKNSSVRLLNNEGCPERNILSEFKLYRSRGSANATLYSMFRFPDSNTIHFQCDIIVCESTCPLVLCPDNPTEGRSLARLSENEDDHKMVASTTVFVVEPGASSLSAVSATCDLGPSWLLWLCVVFGVLFLIMLCVNVFLCSAMTCSFSKTEVDVVEEKEPSVYTIGQDYDPYRSWAGSQYGSKYSLDHPGTRPLSLDHPGTRSLGINSVDHPGTRTLGTPAPSQYKEAYSNYGASNSRPGSRNGRQSGMSYHNGIGHMYGNSGPVYSGISTGPRPAPAVYQPTTPSRSRTPTRTPQRARSRSRHRTREAGQFDLAPDQYSLHSRPQSQTGSYKTAMRSRLEDRM